MNEKNGNINAFVNKLLISTDCCQSPENTVLLNLGLRPKSHDFPHFCRA